MEGWLAAAIAFVVGSAFMRRRAEAAEEMEPASRDEIITIIREESARANIPAFIPLATAQSESGIQHLPPTGAGQRTTFYPFGIQRNRGADITGLEGDDLDDELLNLRAHIRHGVNELARGYRRHGNDHELIRMFWVYPSAARNGRPFPNVTGSVKTAHRLQRWNDHVIMFGGPPGESVGVA